MILCKETWCNVIINRSPHPACFDKKKKCKAWFAFFLTLGRTRQVTPRPRYKGKGGRVVDGTLLYFLFVSVFRNNFAFSRKPLIFSTSWGIFYGWWHRWRTVRSTNMVTILVAILDFITKKNQVKKGGESILRINIYYINTNEIPDELSTEKLYPDMWK